jgi:Kef-type K+ transport system membrane component KefB
LQIRRAIALRLGQPQVVAEMVAGVLLGHHFLDWFGQKRNTGCFLGIVPQKIRDTQSYFSRFTLGLALYMFVVGWNFESILCDEL